MERSLSTALPEKYWNFRSLLTTIVVILTMIVVLSIVAHVVGMVPMRRWRLRCILLVARACIRITRSPDSTGNALEQADAPAWLWLLL